MPRSAFSAASPGALFREFAFTLAGAVIISGVVAVTLSPMMCSLLLTREMLHGRFVRLIDRIFSRLAEWYGRRLDRSLDYRPVTALFAAAVFASLVFMYMNTKAELAPEEDQGVLFALTKAPQYSNLDYQEAYTDKLDQALQLVPRDRSALHRQRPVRAQPGHRRRDPQALGRAQALGAAAEAADAAKAQRRRRDERVRLFAAAIAGDRSAACRCRW